MHVNLWFDMPVPLPLNWPYNLIHDWQTAATLMELMAAAVVRSVLTAVGASIILS